MCGIIGYYCLEKNKSVSPYFSALKNALEILAHRGPDDFHLYHNEDKDLAFGHRRLSIVDLSPTGAQPMASHCKKFIICYNGEIYNAPEIKEKLTQLGKTFKGTSDTEVIIEAITVWGVEKTVEMLIGMFAFAVWDIEKRRLHLVRDRMGIKPVYWSLKNNALIFASEIKAIKQFPSHGRDLSEQGLNQYLSQGCIGGQYSIYQDIQKLEPGHILTFDEDASPKITQYWSLKEKVHEARKQSKISSLEEAAELITPLLNDATKRRMVADVPLGSFLSGGIDSSLVTSLMQANSRKPIKTFSIGFDDENYNEASHAKLVAAHLGTDHHEYYLTEVDALKLVPNLTQVFDEPFSDSSQLPTQLLCHMVKKEVTVALSGDGGDELFAGYTRYQWAKRISNIQNRLPYGLRRAIGHSIKLIPSNLMDASANIFNSNRNTPSVPMSRRVNKFVNAIMAKDTGETYKSLITQWPDFTTASRIGTIAKQARELQLPTAAQEMQFLDQLTYLPDDILTKVDRTSMAESLEVRVPILDHRVVEASWQIPNQINMHNGTGKAVLKEILYQHVPQTLIDRPKVGFGVPLEKWLRGSLKEWAETLIHETAWDDLFNISTKKIHQSWQQHLSEHSNNADPIWTILMLADWYNHEKKN